MVILENLPPTFSEATLRSIIDHVTCKGKVLSCQLVPDVDNIVSAQVQFERADDAEAAVRLWDHLTIDNMTITAQCEADAKRRLSKSVSAQHNAGLRYPFAPMSVGWLCDFTTSLKNPEKSFAMCRILECLMHNAVLGSDAFMEHAVVTYYTKFQNAAWTKAQNQVTDGVTFELSRQVFEVIGLIRRFTSANMKSKRMLVTLVERVTDDMARLIGTNPSLQQNKTFPVTLQAARDDIAKLKAGALVSTAAITAAPLASTPEIEDTIHSLTSNLKVLFTCLNSHHNVNSTAAQQQQQQAAILSIYLSDQPVVPCSELCPCFARLRNRFPIYLADVEKVKILDSLVIFSIRDGEEDVSTIAKELQHRYSIEFCARAVAHVHNGHYAIMRLHLFHTVFMAKKLTNGAPLPASQWLKALTVIELIIFHVQYACQGQVPGLIAAATKALASVIDLRGKNEDQRAAANQECFALQSNLTQMFAVLAAPQYLLCVHVGAEARLIMAHSKPKCANPACVTPPAELLKCSACKSVYYCSATCQKADWRDHKLLCRELSLARNMPSGSAAYVRNVAPTGGADAGSVAKLGESPAPPLFSTLRLVPDMTMVAAVRGCYEPASAMTDGSADMDL